MSLRSVVIAVACVSASSLVSLGCQFGGWVPKGKHVPVAEEEREIADLAFGEPTAGTLDCTNGRCRVRYRLRVAAPGHVDVVVTGPRGTAETPGPRLARAMLQDVDGRVVARNGIEQELEQDDEQDDEQDVEQDDGPMSMEADVSPGPYFVLIQGLGGAFEYRVRATYAPDAATAHAGGAAAASSTGAAGAAATPVRRAPVRRGATAHAPGDARDGADFAADPAADLLAMRTFAFAQNPQSQLDGGSPEDHGNPFVIRRVQREIRYVLADAGVTQAEADEADYLVSVQIGSQSTTWYSLGNVPHVTPYDTYFDRWSTAGAFINPHTYVDGTLVIDFIDPRSGELVWHGWTTEPINVKLDDEKLLSGAVQSVLSQVVGK